MNDDFPSVQQRNHARQIALHRAQLGLRLPTVKVRAVVLKEESEVHKSEGRRQKAESIQYEEAASSFLLPSASCLLPSAYCCSASRLNRRFATLACLANRWVDGSNLKRRQRNTRHADISFAARAIDDRHGRNHVGPGVAQGCDRFARRASGGNDIFDD